METTWIFRPAKLRQKNSWKFGLRPIDVISTLNRRGFEMVCALGSRILEGLCGSFNIQITTVGDTKSGTIKAKHTDFFTHSFK